MSKFFQSHLRSATYKLMNGLNNMSPGTQEVMKAGAMCAQTLVAGYLNYQAIQHRNSDEVKAHNRGRRPSR